MPLYPNAFPVITGKGDRASGGRGTKRELLLEGFHFVQQLPFLCPYGFFFSHVLHGTA